MSATPKFDDSALAQALGGRSPASTSREGRIGLIGEAAAALLEKTMPSDEARIFLAAALIAWLESGGDLAKDFLRVTRPKSHLTVARVWRRIEEARHRR